MRTDRDPRDIARRAIALRAEGLSWREIARRFGTRHSNIRYWVQKYADAEQHDIGTQRVTTDTDDDGKTVEATGEQIHTLEALLDAAQVDRAQWVVTKHIVNTWDGKWQVKAWLAPVPEWLPSMPPPTERLTARPLPDTTGAESCLFVPDQQFGFRWDYDARTLKPIHDPVAIALAEEVARRMRPDVIVLAGDLLDFAAFSTKYLVDPQLRNTATPSLQAAHDHLAALSEVAQVLLIPGNHDIRIAKAAQTYLPELVHLRPANSEVELLSLERLLDMESIGACLVPGGFPDAEVYLFDGLARFTHATKVKPGGQCAADVLKSATCSTFYGHTHQPELVPRSIHESTGRRVIWAGGPGTLSNVLGDVPGSHKPSWGQGVLEVYRRGQRLFPSLVHFEGREAFWRGQWIGC